MTNTLHRYGDAESLRNDIIVFAIPSRGYNDGDCVPKLREFLRIALRHQPVNLGDASRGGIFRPSRLTPLAHWFRRSDPDPAGVIEKIDRPTTVAAVFDRREAAERCLEEVRRADLGLSVNVSATIEGARECCQAAGLKRHSVEYSLGFMGRSERLAERRVLELATMCGHGMISFSLARKMIDYVKEGRRTPDQACATLARFCSCGVFNPTRARDLFETCRCGRM